MRVNSTAHRIVLNALRDLPGLEISPAAASSTEDGLDLQVSWTGAETTYVLTVLWAREGWPSDVRQAIANISDPWPRHVVVAARSLSPGALDELRRRDANWIDEAGNACLQVPPGLIVLKVAGEKARKKATTFSWSSSGVVVAEFMLVHRYTRFSLKELADQTGWSAPQASNVLRAFDEKGWTTRHGPARGGGVWRELTNPGSLLDAWSAHLGENRPLRRLGYRLLRDPIRFLRGELAPLLDRFGRWAVTGWVGLEIIAPHISVVPALQVYLPADRFHDEPSAIFRSGGIREVEEGANIEIWSIDAPLLTQHHKSGDLPVVNLARLYSDLLAVGGRARDGAQHLRETRIGF